MNSVLSMFHGTRDSIGIRKTIHRVMALGIVLVLFASASAAADGEIVFLGNSITEGGKWSKYFPGLPVVNHGVSGDTTLDILRRLDRTIERRPRKIFLMAGINDLGSGRRVERIVADYERIVKRIRTGSPESTLYLQSVLPVNDRIFRRPARHEDIIALNFQIRSLARRLSLAYIDLYQIMRTDGRRLDPAYTRDGLHLNPKGYDVWVTAIRQYVR